MHAAAGVWSGISWPGFQVELRIMFVLLPAWLDQAAPASSCSRSSAGLLAVTASVRDTQACVPKRQTGRLACSCITASAACCAAGARCCPLVAYNTLRRLAHQIALCAMWPLRRGNWSSCSMDAVPPQQPALQQQRCRHPRQLRWRRR